MGFLGHPGCWRRSPKVGVFPEKEILPAIYQIKGEWIGLLVECDVRSKLNLKE